MNEWHDTIPTEPGVLGSTIPLPTSCRGGSCRQGRDICRTPLACQPAEDEIGVVRGLLSWPCLVSAALVGALVLAMVLL